MIPDNQIRSTRRDRGISFSYLKLPHKEESPRPLGLLLLRSLNGDDLQPIYLNPPRARSSTRDAKIDNIFSSGSRDLPPLLFSFQVAALPFNQRVLLLRNEEGSDSRELAGHGNP